jgi:hypothetical protein
MGTIHLHQSSKITSHQEDNTFEIKTFLNFFSSLMEGSESGSNNCRSGSRILKAQKLTDPSRSEHCSVGLRFCAAGCGIWWSGKRRVEPRCRWISWTWTRAQARLPPTAVRSSPSPHLQAIRSTEFFIRGPGIMKLDPIRLRIQLLYRRLRKNAKFPL